MKYNTIADKIERLTKIESDYKRIISEYKTGTDIRIIASPYFFIPPEINAAFDIITLKIPDFLLTGDNSVPERFNIYDAIVISDRAAPCNENLIHNLPAYVFKTPHGFGEDAAVSLHNEIMAMLQNLFGIDIKSINIETLKRKTAVYDRLRRLIRSITSLRNENRHMLSNTDLALIFETALILPPEIAIDYIAPVFDEMNKITEKDTGYKIKGMLYGGRNISSEIADFIEENGILLIEDDSCSGRRLFDLSVNAESEYIFYELLDACSYRALPPCLRPVNERYELLYKLLKNYSIETVIFYRDEFCGESSKDIEYLRIKMMRDGIDPLVIDRDNYKKIVKEYADRL